MNREIVSNAPMRVVIPEEGGCVLISYIVEVYSDGRALVEYRPEFFPPV